MEIHISLTGSKSKNVNLAYPFQEWCEGLADIIWTMRQQVKQLQQLREKVGDPQGSPNDQELLMNITEALTNLVTGTFIIEKQPPQVELFSELFLVFMHFASILIQNVSHGIFFSL